MHFKSLHFHIISFISMCWAVKTWLTKPGRHHGWYLDNNNNQRIGGFQCRQSCSELSARWPSNIVVSGCAPMLRFSSFVFGHDTWLKMDKLVTGGLILSLLYWG